MCPLKAFDILLPDSSAKQLHLKGDFIPNSSSWKCLFFHCQHQILLYYSFRFFDDSQFYRQKKSANLFFFQLYLLWEKQDFLKSFSKTLDFPHVFQHHVDGTTVMTLGLRMRDSLYQNANIVSCHRRFCQNITWLNFKPKYQQLCSERRGRGSIK